MKACCPKCGAQFSASSVNLEASLGKCESCHDLFLLANIAPNFQSLREAALNSSGYHFELKDGSVVEFPANTIVTRARDTIDEHLRERGIPITIKVSHREPK